MMRVTRADRSRLAEWWFTVDHVLIVAIMALMLSGLVLSLAASPAIALKKNLPTFYFFERHVAFSAAGFAMMIALSFLTPSLARRSAAILLAGTLAALVWVLFDSSPINGSRRWLNLGVASLQPSEFIKPAFVIIAAWLFAEARRRPDMPALPMAIALGALVCGLLVLQPDVGQTHPARGHLGRDVSARRAAARRCRHSRWSWARRFDRHVFCLSARPQPHRPLHQRFTGAELAGSPRL